MKKKLSLNRHYSNEQVTGKHQMSELEPRSLTSEVQPRPKQFHDQGRRHTRRSAWMLVKTGSLMIRWGLLSAKTVGCFLTKRKTKGTSWAFDFIVGPPSSGQGKRQVAHYKAHAEVHSLGRDLTPQHLKGGSVSLASSQGSPS